MMFDLSSWNWIEAMGWTLLHFVWQAALIGIIAWVALRSCNRKNSSLRYGIASVGMAGMALAPVITMAMLLTIESAAEDQISELSRSEVAWPS